MPGFLTTREVGEMLGAPEWLIRRVVDSLPVRVERFGLRRMIPPSLVPVIAQGVAQRRRGGQ